MEKGLLDDVLRVVRVTKQVSGKAQRLPAVPVYEFPERGLVTGQHPADEQVVGLHQGLTIRRCWRQKGCKWPGAPTCSRYRRARGPSRQTTSVDRQRIDDRKPG